MLRQLGFHRKLRAQAEARFFLWISFLFWYFAGGEVGQFRVPGLGLISGRAFDYRLVYGPAQRGLCMRDSLS